MPRRQRPDRLVLHALEQVLSHQHRLGRCRVPPGRASTGSAAPPTSAPRWAAAISFSPRGGAMRAGIRARRGTGRPRRSRRSRVCGAGSACAACSNSSATGRDELSSRCCRAARILDAYGADTMSTSFSIPSAWRPRATASPTMSAFLGAARPCPVVDGTPAGHLAWGDGILPLGSYLEAARPAGYWGSSDLRAFRQRFFDALDPVAAWSRCLTAVSSPIDRDLVAGMGDRADPSSRSATIASTSI